MRSRHVLAVPALVLALAGPAVAAPHTREHPVLAAPAAVAAPARESADPTVGARSAGDEIFPTIGNGGYDAQHYDLNLAYVPGAHQLSGTATMTAVATQALREFS
ncbi:MAG: hypothetical protein QOG68_2197, partial [Solirubrobacteraceae bacterium]|nr:hypothetical protein [Solirubrobacteraceae bacterium]